jgi:hypothetical protein
MALHGCIVRGETSICSPQMRPYEPGKDCQFPVLAVLLGMNPDSAKNFSGCFNEHEQHSRRMNAATIATHQEVHA